MLNTACAMEVQQEGLVPKDGVVSGIGQAFKFITSSLGIQSDLPAIKQRKEDSENGGCDNPKLLFCRAIDRQHVEHLRYLIAGESTERRVEFRFTFNDFPNCEKKMRQQYKCKTLNGGFTAPLDIAIEYENRDIVKTLLYNRADVNPDRSQRNVFLWGVGSRREDYFMSCLPIERAMIHGNVKLVKLLSAYPVKRSDACRGLEVFIKEGGDLDTARELLFSFVYHFHNFDRHGNRRKNYRERLLISACVEKKLGLPKETDMLLGYSPDSINRNGLKWVEIEEATRCCRQIKSNKSDKFCKQWKSRENIGPGVEEFFDPKDPFCVRENFISARCGEMVCQ